MKRRKPLTRSGLRRSQKPLKRSPLKRSSIPLKPKSERQKRRDAAFRANEPAELIRICQRCNQRRATDRHHIAPRARRPDLVGDPANKEWVCRICHDELTLNPEPCETYEMMLYRRRNGLLEEEE